jgi:hypothetical protein
MATNLIAFVTQALTPEVSSRIASARGVDRPSPKRQPLLGYAVSKSGGERQLPNTRSQQPSGALDTLMKVIVGFGQKSLAEQKSFVENGSSLLSGRLGGSTRDALARAGIGEASLESRA